MAEEGPAAVQLIKAVLQSWSDDDLPLLEKLLGDPDMMTRLGRARESGIDPSTTPALCATPGNRNGPHIQDRPGPRVGSCRQHRLLAENLTGSTDLQSGSRVS